MSDGYLSRVHFQPRKRGFDSRASDKGGRDCRGQVFTRVSTPLKIASRKKKKKRLDNEIILKAYPTCTSNFSHHSIFKSTSSFFFQIEKKRQKGRACLSTLNQQHTKLSTLTFFIEPRELPLNRTRFPRSARICGREASGKRATHTHAHISQSKKRWSGPCERKPEGTRHGINDEATPRRASSCRCPPREHSREAGSTLNKRHKQTSTRREGGVATPQRRSHTRRAPIQAEAQSKATGNIEQQSSRNEPPTDIPFSMENSARQTEN